MNPIRIESGGAGARIRQPGFVLVAVLILLVVLSLLAGSVALISQRAVAEARADVEAFEGELDAISTRETVLLLLASQPMTLAGLTVDDQATGRIVAADEDIDGLAVMPIGNEIRLDSHVYAGVGQALFALQDGRGLFSPNFAPAQARIAFYQAMGADVGLQGDLDAKRLDYQDPDDLLRIGGAERPQYLAAGLPPPSNRPVSTPLEFRRILGWNTLLAPHDDAYLLRMLTVDRNVVLNVNSAPHEVLTLFPGVTPEIADRIVALRRTSPFTSVAQVQQLVPTLGEDPEFLTLFGGSGGNLTVWNRNAGTARLFHWTLTPYHDGGHPWRIDYEVTLPRGNTEASRTAARPDSSLFAPQDAPGG